MANKQLRKVLVRDGREQTESCSRLRRYEMLEKTWNSSRRQEKKKDVRKVKSQKV